MSIKRNGGIFGRNPSFGELTVDNNATVGGDLTVSGDATTSGDLTVSGDATTSGLGVGTDSLTSLVNVYEDGSGDAAIAIDNTQIGTSTVIGKQGSSGYGATSVGNAFIYTYDNSISFMADGGAGNTSSIKFATGGNSERMILNQLGNLAMSGGGNIVMNSGSGIDFSATGDGSGTSTSELFDDYEEGTWTPSLGGTTTYTIQTGTYTKCGRLIFVNLTLLISSIGTGSASTISGLPYAASGSIAAINVGTNTNSVTNFYSISGSTGASGTAITMRGQDSLDSGLGTINVFGNGTYLEMSGVYETAT